MPRPASAFLVALACSCNPAFASLQSQQGEARDPDGGNLLYREQHLIQRDGDRIRERLVLYRCADGTAFARKHVDYGDSRFAPDFSLTDARDGYREGLDDEDGTRKVWSGTRQRARPLPASGGVLVADAGFDEFVRARWAKLLGAGSMPIRFVVPAYDKSLGFNVRHIGRATIGDEAVQKFSLKLSGLLSLVSPQIEVSYDDDSHRLRRFSGICNLRSDRGKPLQVRIDFPHAPQSAESGQWREMLDTPLQACRVGA